MRQRLLIGLFLALFAGSLALGQMPPPPTPTPPPSPTQPPGGGGTMPPGYACQDPDTGVWVPYGGTRTKVTSPAIDGGTQTVTEMYRCLNGAWKIENRVTIWNTTTGQAWYEPGLISESGTKKETYNSATGCLTLTDEMIGRFTRVSIGILSFKDDYRCIWNTSGQDCQNPESYFDRFVERWLTKYLYPHGTFNGTAGYTETNDSVGYDATGKLVQDFHSDYKRLAVGIDDLIVTTVGNAQFTVNYFEQGQTVAHPMSYYMNYLVGGGPNGGNVWSGASQIPQYDAFGNFTGYASETIGQILGRARAHEYLQCGTDDGTTWPWWPGGGPPPMP
jgi:hypothetical protein